MRLILAVAVLALGAAAHAHSWYPVQCCDERDCFAVSNDAVALTARGWRIEATGEIVPLGKTAFSPDGRFHRCSPGGAVGARTLCLFVPRLGS
jgi:hypothetical protein